MFESSMMNRGHREALRTNTAYEGTRSVIGFVGIVGMLGGAVGVAAALLGYDPIEWHPIGAAARIVVGLVYGSGFLAWLFFYLLATALIDGVDAVIHISRNSRPKDE